MKKTRGVVMFGWALLGAVSMGCAVAPREEAASRSEPLLAGCAKDAQCEDGNPCTQNLCALGLCAPSLPVLGCCYEGECTDDETKDALAPVLTLPPSGCSTHDECEDHHPCTQNLCVAGTCASLPVLGCCLNGECAEPNGQGGEGGESSGSGGATGGSHQGSGGTGGVPPAAGRGGAADAGGAGAAGEASPSPLSNAPDWQMRGGGCSVTTADTRSSVHVALALGALVLVIGGRRRRSGSLRHSPRS
jgi:MYXO-CTERM domain-containing protein